MALKLHPQFVVDDSGARRSVLLSIEEFNAMLEELENYADAEALRKAMAETGPDDWMDWEEYTAKLRAEGKID